jgi:hypothetical protein
MRRERIVGWVARLILIAFIALDAYIWVEILVLQREEYDRLVGSESACGVVENYCSWPAFVLDRAPIDALAILAAIALLWRSLPRRELALWTIIAAVCIYLGWRFYDRSTRYPPQAASGRIEGHAEWRAT